MTPLKQRILEVIRECDHDGIPFNKLATKLEELCQAESVAQTTKLNDKVKELEASNGRLTNDVDRLLKLAPNVSYVQAIQVAKQLQGQIESLQAKVEDYEKALIAIDNGCYDMSYISQLLFKHQPKTAI